MIDFDKELNRIHTNSIKWDGRKEYFGREDVLPLWVADTDFPLMDEIKEAIIKRLNTGNFGYARTPDEFYTSIIDWSKKRHNWTIEKDTIIPNVSVLSSLHNLLKLISKEGDNVLMLSPIYYPFKDRCEKLNRNPIFCDMDVEDEKYVINFDRLEAMIKEKKPTVFIFCNPHNPSGRVWTYEEQKQLLQLLKKYEIEVISDEIHKDVIFKGFTFTPFETIDDSYKEHIHTITAPTKTFNLAGLKVAYVIIHDRVLRKKFEIEAEQNGSLSLSTISYDASVAAYTKGHPWVDALNEYLEQNYITLRDGLASTKFHAMPLEGTFLAWIKFDDYGKSWEDMKELLLDAGLGIQMGHIFGDAGDNYIRLNLGTTNANIKKAVDLFKNVHQSIIK